MKDLILKHLQIDLTEAIQLDGDTNHLNPIHTNPYNAMSAMQKAIRRGDTGLALRAAATLLTHQPNALWRRLGVTAFEDIGVANYQLAGQTALCVNAVRLRRHLGGDWKVASHLIRRMCESAKDRAADDLFVQLCHDPDLTEIHSMLSYTDIPNRIAYLNNTNRLDHAGTTVWQLFGTDRVRADGIPIVKGNPTTLFDAMLDLGYCATIVEIARLGVKKTGDILPAFMPILWERSKEEAQTTTADDLPEVRMIGGLPSYTFDNHTRDGNTCFREFIKRSQDMRGYLQSCNIQPRDWGRIAGKLTFRVESGLLAQRMNWQTGQVLLTKGNHFGRGIPLKQVPVGLKLMKRSIPLLNDVREDVLGAK